MLRSRFIGLGCFKRLAALVLLAFFSIMANAQSLNPYFEVGAGLSLPSGSFAQLSTSELKKASSAKFLCLGWAMQFNKWFGFAIESSFQKFPSETRYFDLDEFPMVKTEYQVFTFMASPTIHHEYAELLNLEIRPMIGLQSVYIPTMQLDMWWTKILTRNSISHSFCYGIKAKYGMNVPGPWVLFVYGSYYHSSQEFVINQSWYDLGTFVGWHSASIPKDVSYFSVGISLAYEFPLKQTY
jgi:hypothetical protein